MCSYISMWPETYRTRATKQNAPPPAPFDEPNAAAALINLFHRLPVTNASQVLESLVTGVCRFEAALPSYKYASAGRRTVNSLACLPRMSLQHPCGESRGFA
jgi:hypothetical protein